MPGDVLSSGHIILESGRYDFPYIETLANYNSPNFGVANQNGGSLGQADNLGDDCAGQGLAVDGICYAFGAVVDGYTVMPPRTENCDNSTGDYCYAHLRIIEPTPPARIVDTSNSRARRTNYWIFIASKY